MVEMKNRITGTKMWVSDEKVSDYLKAGHEMINHEAQKVTMNDVPDDFMNPPVEQAEASAEPVKRGRGRGTRSTRK